MFCLTKLHADFHLQKTIEDSQPSSSESEEGTKALVFDSVFDPYRGVVAYVRVFSGNLQNEQKHDSWEQKQILKF